MEAAYYGHTAVVRLLLGWQAAVPAAAEHGYTALHYAAQEGHTSIVRLLLDAQADVNAADKEGWTVLHAAVGFAEGKPALVRLLLAAGADVNVTNAQHQPPLRGAAAAGHTEMLHLLLAAPQMAATGMAGAAEAAAAAGHVDVAILVLKALRDCDMPAAAAVVAGQAVAAEVIRQWQAAEDAVTELEGQWPAVQELIVSIATAHQQLQATREVLGGTADAGAVAAGSVAVVGDAAPLCGDKAASCSCGDGQHQQQEWRSSQVQMQLTGCSALTSCCGEDSTCRTKHKCLCMYCLPAWHSVCHCTRCAAAFSIASRVTLHV